MFALRSHHTIERTPEGEYAWRHVAMHPSDRRLLGALREPLLVASLLSSAYQATSSSQPVPLALDPGFDPPELEGVVSRLVRKGWVRIDMESIGPPSTTTTESLSPGNQDSPIDPDRALSDLLARQHPSSTTSEDHPQVLDRLDDVSPLPLDASPQELSDLMSALQSRPTHSKSNPGQPHRTRHTPSSIHSPGHQPTGPQPQGSDEGPWTEGVADLMRALGATADRTQRSTQSASDILADQAPHREAHAEPRVFPRATAPPKSASPDATGFLRIKDALERRTRDEVVDRSSRSPKASPGSSAAPMVRPPLTSSQAQALAAREKREAKTRQRQEEMAEQRALEQRAAQSKTLLGVSDMLRRTIAGNKEDEHG